MLIREDVSERADDRDSKFSGSQKYYGSVAQSVEQWTENPCVGGSIPS